MKVWRNYENFNLNGININDMSNNSGNISLIIIFKDW